MSDCAHDWLVVGWQYIYRPMEKEPYPEWISPGEREVERLRRENEKVLYGMQARKIWCRKCDAVEFMNLKQDI